MTSQSPTTVAAKFSSTPLNNKTLRVVKQAFESIISDVGMRLDTLQHLENDRAELAKEKQALQTAEEQLAKEKNEYEKAMDAKLNEQLVKEKAKLNEQLVKEKEESEKAMKAKLKEQLEKEESEKAMNAKLNEQLVKEMQALETEKDESKKAMNTELENERDKVRTKDTELTKCKNELTKCKNELNVLKRKFGQVAAFFTDDGCAESTKRQKGDCNYAEEHAKKSQREIERNAQVLKGVDDQPDVLNSDRRSYELSSQECYELREALEDADGVKDAEDVSNESNPKVKDAEDVSNESCQEVKDAAGGIFVGDIENFDSAKLNKCGWTCVQGDEEVGCGQRCSYRTVKQIREYAINNHVHEQSGHYGFLPMTKDAIKNTKLRSQWQHKGNDPKFTQQF